MFKTFLQLKSVLIFLVFVVFAFKATLALDPDFGWRLRTGSEIIKSGVPKTDIYSYTMPSFPWVDHAWLSDIFISLTYFLSGTAGLGILFAFIAVFALLLSASGQRYFKDWLFFLPLFRMEKRDLWFFGSAPFLLSIAALHPFSGVRVQVITWFFFAVLLKVVFNEKLWKSFRFWAPLFFLLWANFHGGFAAGLGVFWLVLLMRVFSEKGINVTNFLILILSTLSTFVNPYGWGIYREVWSSVSDSSLRFEIIEWQPAFFSFDIPSISLIALSCLFVFIYRKRLNFPKVVIFFLLLIQGLSSIRHFPLFVLVALPFTTEAINYFYHDVKSNKISKERFKIFYSYFWVYTLVILVVQIILSFRGAFYLSENNFYPRGAVAFVKSEKFSGNIFSDYAWGGYLIWKYPEKRVFIDGRMPSWKWSANLQNESNYIMKDYLDTVKGKKDHTDFFEKYDIEVVIWPAKKPKGFMDSLEEKFGNKLGFLYNLLGVDRGSFYLADKLSETGWKKVYEDKVSVVLKKED